MMSFTGYRKDFRGNWFGGGTRMIYVDESTFQEKKEAEFYIVNEQECHIIRIRDEQQIIMMHHCMYGTLVKHENIEWLIQKASFKYYDSVQEFIEK